MSDPDLAGRPSRLVAVLKKAGYALALVVLTLIIFGPAVPLDMALLLASAVLLQIGFFTHSATRSSLVAGLKERARSLIRLIRAP